MPWARRQRPIARTLIGVAALYALLLQAFVAAAAPRLPDLNGVLCAEHAGTPGFPDQPAHPDGHCCTLVGIQGMAAPVAPHVLVDWTPPRSTRVLWRPEASIAKTGPPAKSHSARGPPVA